MEKNIVDPYGDKVARCNLLGENRWLSHEELKEIMGAIFKQVGFMVSVELPNIFHRKVPGKAVEICLDIQVYKDFIRHDILTHDHPTNTNGSGVRIAEAIFDMVTMRIDTAETYTFESV